MESSRHGFVAFALLVCAACHQGTPAPQEPTNEPPPGEPAVDACAAVRCMAGTHCVLQGEGAACEPDGSATGASCAATLCATGTYCDDAGGTARCIALPSCDASECADGQHCELVQVQCVRAPCPPQPSCVPNKI